MNQMPLSQPLAMHELRWSPAEKAVTRRAFDFALRNELQATVREAKERAAWCEEAPDLWKLEDWLGRRRREIDSKYDYRYSVLPIVFVRLLREGRLSEGDLNGLGPDKLNFILSLAAL